MGRNIYVAFFFERLHARITKIKTLIEISVMDIFAVADWPAIVLSLTDDIDFIRRQIIAQQIASHFGCPHLLSIRTPGKKHGVPQTSGIFFEVTAIWLHREN